MAGKVPNDLDQLIAILKNIFHALNGDISPSSITPGVVRIPNAHYIIFQDFAGAYNNCYIIRGSDDTLNIANLKSGEELVLVVTMASGNQRTLRLREDGSTNNLMVEFGYDTIFKTDNGDIELRPADDLLLYPVGDIFVTTYERHIQLPATLMGNPSNQPTEVDFFTTAGLQFPTTGAKYSFFQWELPDDWDGTDVFVEVDWFADSAAMAGTDTVQWIVQYACVAEGEVHGAALYNTLTLTNSDDNARYLSIHSRGTMPYNDINQPLSKQDHIYFKVTRNTAVANDFGGSVTVPAFEIIYNSKQIPRGN